MSRPLKRRRVASDAPARRGSRPIDKELKVISQTITTSVVATTLKTTTFPCTIVGLRWSFTQQIAITTGDSDCWWAIIVVRDGRAASTPSTSDGADFYTPEQDVLAFGHGVVRDADVSQGPGTVSFEGVTKTMRKLMGGDLLQFITISSTAVSANVNGVIQFFCKS